MKHFVKAIKTSDIETSLMQKYKSFLSYTEDLVSSNGDKITLLHYIFKDDSIASAFVKANCPNRKKKKKTKVVVLNCQSTYARFKEVLTEVLYTNEIFFTIDSNKDYYIINFYSKFAENHRGNLLEHFLEFLQ